jgi:hypothetical protein
MSAAAVIALVVAAGEGQGPVTESLLAAAEEAVGAGTIRVFEATPPSDDAALEVETNIDALAVVTLVWEDPARLRAHTRVHIARLDRWTDREIAFVPADTMVERGRAVGFAIASMLPDELRARRPAAVEVGRSAPASASSEAPRALGLYALGATDVGGGAGGTIDGTWAIVEALVVRVALGARYWTIDVGTGGHGHDLVASASAGLGWWPLVPTAGSPFGLGFHLDALFLRHEVFLRLSDNTPDRYGRSSPGADLMAEGALRVGDGVDLVVGLGAEAAFGAINVDIGIDGQNATSTQAIPRVRAVGELGVRLHF